MIYVDVISNKQSIFSSQICTPSFPINWPSLVSTARSPIILWRLWSYKPSHKHDSNKHQSKAFVICDHKSDETRSVTHVNKVYLVWLMFRGRTQFSKIVGFAGKRFLHSPSPPPSFLFFALVPTFSTNSRGNACYAGYKIVKYCILSEVCMIKSVPHSTVSPQMWCTNGKKLGFHSPRFVGKIL